jgi:sugar phosphate isomerase/epimerase
VNPIHKEHNITTILGCTTRPYAALNFAGACERIAAAGYSDVAVFGRDVVHSQSTREETLAACRTAQDAGLEPSMLLGRVQLDQGLDAVVNDYRSLIDNAALLGATWLLECGTSREELYPDYVAVMRRVAPYAQAAGITITLKPHGGITLTTADLIDVYRRVDHPGFGLCYDPGNIIFYSLGEERPETHVAEVAPLVATGIIKDCVLNDGVPDVMVTPGEGLVDFHAILPALVAGGFSGPLYLECVGGTTIDEIDQNVRRSLAFVREALAQ